MAGSEITISDVLLKASADLARKHPESAVTIRYRDARDWRFWEVEFTDGLTVGACYGVDDQTGELVSVTDEWTPEYSRWRHGGWYVDNIHYPSGAVGCVSRNYGDRKWRIVCDPRDGEHTYESRDAAARAERVLAGIAHATERLVSFAESLGLTAEDVDELVRDAANEVASGRYNSGERPGTDDEESHELLHDEADAQAAEINNRGLAAQVAYLLDGWPADDLRRLLQEQASAQAAPAR